MINSELDDDIIMSKVIFVLDSRIFISCYAVLFALTLSPSKTHHIIHFLIDRWLYCTPMYGRLSETLNLIQAKSAIIIKTRMFRKLIQNKTVASKVSKAFS